MEGGGLAGCSIPHIVVFHAHCHWYGSSMRHVQAGVVRALSANADRRWTLPQRRRWPLGDA